MIERAREREREINIRIPNTINRKKITCIEIIVWQNQFRLEDIILGGGGGGGDGGGPGGTDLPTKDHLSNAQ